MTNKHPDWTLVQSARSGDTQAWQLLVDRLACIRPFLISKSRKSGFPLQPNELDDLASEALTIVVGKLGEFRGESSIETWIHSFCEFHLMNYRRRKARDAKHEPLDLVADDLVAPGSTWMADLESQVCNPAPG